MAEFQKKIEMVANKAGNDPIERFMAINKLLISHINNKLVPALMGLKSSKNKALENVVKDVIENNKEKTNPFIKLKTKKLH